jgi:hypothetical protein
MFFTVLGKNTMKWFYECGPLRIQASSSKEHIITKRSIRITVYQLIKFTDLIGTDICDKNG